LGKTGRGEREEEYLPEINALIIRDSRQVSMREVLK
jgi:hypothetical protein